MADVMVATAAGLHRVRAGEVEIIDDRSITALARDGDHVVALVGRTQVLSSEGDSWTVLGELETDEGTCIAGTSDLAWVGLAGAHLASVEDGQIWMVEEFERAPTRDDWHTPWGGPPDLRSIAVDDGVLHVNVHVGGVLSSRDRGVTWEPVLPIDDDAHQVIVAPDGRLLCATGASGLAVGGPGAWEYWTEGLHGTYLRAVAVSGDAVLVTASTGPAPGEAAVYRRRFGAEVFERCTSGLPERFGANIDTFWLDATDELAAFVSPDGDVYVSEDQGRVWDRAAEGLPSPHALVITAET